MLICRGGGRVNMSRPLPQLHQVGRLATRFYAGDDTPSSLSRSVPLIHQRRDRTADPAHADGGIPRVLHGAVTGAVLTTGKRTVSAVLRVMGLSQSGDFALYHHVLSQARWDSRAIARQLLLMILERFLPSGPVIIGIDDTIERRWGKKIAARGIYRDPVRSSHGHFVKASGLRWLSFMAMVPLPFTHRRWALSCSASLGNGCCRNSGY